VDERHQHRHHSPGNHDAHDPATSSPSLHDQRPGDFQQEVTEKENPRSEPDHTLAEPEIMGHLERRRTNVHAIEKCDHVQQKQKGEEPPRDTMPGALNNLGLSPGRYDGLGSVRDR